MHTLPPTTHTHHPLTHKEKIYKGYLKHTLGYRENLLYVHTSEEKAGTCHPQSSRERRHLMPHTNIETDRLKRILSTGMHTHTHIMEYTKTEDKERDRQTERRERKE